MFRKEAFFFFVVPVFFFFLVFEEVALPSSPSESSSESSSPAQDGTFAVVVFFFVVVVFASESSFLELTPLYLAASATPLSLSVRSSVLSVPSVGQSSEEESTTTTSFLAAARAAARRVAELIWVSTKASMMEEKRRGKSRTKVRASAAKRDRAFPATSSKVRALNLARSTSFSVLAVARTSWPEVDVGSMTFRRFSKESSCVRTEALAAASRSSRLRTWPAAMRRDPTAARSSARSTMAASTPYGSSKRRANSLSDDDDDDDDSFFGVLTTTSMRTPPAARRFVASFAAVPREALATLALWDAMSRSCSFSLAQRRTSANSSASSSEKSIDPVTRAVAALMENSAPANSAEYMSFGGWALSKNSSNVRLFFSSS
mmetsp:Transcript_25985/g.84119  ORF Transcript_25985/g.84119 Transcript_25985/m.84119 type:complete len:375 (-) Transcript_25985:349-1473(-)